MFIVELMPLIYTSNLLVLLCKTDSSIRIDLEKLLTVLSNSYFYRGSVFFKKSNITFKYARNGYCYIFIKEITTPVLQSLHLQVIDPCLRCFFMCTNEEFSLFHVDVLNYQLTFEIFYTQQKKLSIKNFFVYIFSTFKSRFRFYIRESEAIDDKFFPFLFREGECMLEQKIENISSFRIKDMDNSFTFTLKYNLTGSVITRSPKYFLDFCESISGLLCD